MIPLIYDKDMIERMIAYAESHPLPFDVLQRYGAAFDPELVQKYQVVLPLSQAIFTYTVEEQAPGHWFKHFSVLPAFNKAVVKHLCQEFGINLDSPEAYCYLDDANAVNIDHPYPEFSVRA